MLLRYIQIFKNLFIYFLAVPCGLKDLSSLTRDLTLGQGSECAEL